MEGYGRHPKSWPKAFALYAAGAAVKVEDADMADVVFLVTHPGWSYADLMATPDLIVAGIRLLDQKRAQAAK